jgi:SAM-dependent methyltransferase
MGLTVRSRILDVGCGAGRLLHSLAGIGFQSLLGIDRFLRADRAGAAPGNPGCRIERLDISEVRGPFDLVMFHHSFEHLDDPEGTLRHVARLLAPGGWCLIRTPTPSSFAWREYGTDWVQLDAPRHLCLASVAGAARLADRAGFRLLEVRDDSTAFQFWGSEQYRRGIPLESERSYAKHPDASPFSRREIRAFEARARELNRRRDGDQVALYLRRAATPSRDASVPAG